MMIFNPQYPKIMTTYITECHCMEKESVTRTEQWAHMLEMPTDYFLSKPSQHPFLVQTLSSIQQVKSDLPIC